MAALDVITFGEAMAMFVADEPGDLATVSRFTRRQSGAEANVAIGLARLGLRVGWVSRVGDDSFGRFILETMTSEGVDCSHVTVDKQHSTGIQLKSKAEGGADPRTEYFRKGSAASHLSVDDFDPRISDRHATCTRRACVARCPLRRWGSPVTRWTSCAAPARAFRSTPTCARRCGRRATR